MSITFTNFRNPTWEDKIELQLNAHLEAVTGRHTSQLQGIYCFHETQHIGGVLFQKEGSILWIDGLFVDMRFRRQGVGRELIAEVTHYAKQHDIHCFQLSTYFAEARDFFKACDFEEISIIPNWKYGSTCYFMKKTL